MSDLEKKLKEIFPEGSFTREVPRDLKNDTTVTLRMNSLMVESLKELASKKDISYQALIKEVLWKYLDSYNENNDAAQRVQLKFQSFLKENLEDIEMAMIGPEKELKKA